MVFKRESQGSGRGQYGPYSSVVGVGPRKVNLPSSSYSAFLRKSLHNSWIYYYACCTHITSVGIVKSSLSSPFCAVSDRDICKFKAEVELHPVGRTKHPLPWPCLLTSQAIPEHGALGAKAQGPLLEPELSLSTCPRARTPRHTWL